MPLKPSKVILFKKSERTTQNNTYEGKFYATKEKKALWIYDKPVAKKIYFNKPKWLS